MQTEATASKLTPDLATLSQPSDSQPARARPAQPRQPHKPARSQQLLEPGSNQAQRHPGAF